jgi:uncharacterized membrane protein
MTNKSTINLNLTLFTAAWVIIAVTSFYVCLSLPNDLQLPIHWNINLEPDSYANKWFALLMLPAVSVLIALVMTVLPMFEPRKQNLMLSGRAYQGVFWAVQLFFLTLQLFILSDAWEWHWPLARFISLGIAMLLLVLGNYIGKTRSTFLFGIRTPWTLSSEQVWRKTHRLAGFGLVATGLFSLISTPWANPLTLGISLIIMAAVFISATIYSYLLWRKEPDHRLN